ncbi:hypothetical protein Tco_1091056 [Tanacetum coccineum]|uniref:Uncharacterized protein n=1 Tax=Tanacetum coccineum TaxID=301880 RepID=A0ABQ5I5Y4_9ASTR
MEKRVARCGCGGSGAAGDDRRYNDDGVAWARRVVQCGWRGGELAERWVWGIGRSRSRGAIFGFCRKLFGDGVVMAVGGRWCRVEVVAG